MKRTAALPRDRRPLGTVEATDERDAIEKASTKRKIPANRLVAVRR